MAKGLTSPASGAMVSVLALEIGNTSGFWNFTNLNGKRGSAQAGNAGGGFVGAKTTPNQRML